MKGSTGHKPVIGLTGGIGSGKSTVARQLKSLGCAVIDSDELAGRVLKEQAVADQLIAWWGSSVDDGRGQVDSPALGRLVFDDPAKLAQLEELVHPHVHALRRAIRKQYEADQLITAIVEDCPLLLEKQLDAECDVVIFVACDAFRRQQRVAKARGWTMAELAQREKNQLPLDLKADRDDYVIDNNATEADTMSHVRRVLSKILHD